LLPALHRESAFLVSAAALSVGVTPDYRNHLDSFAMIAIERSSNASVAVCFALFCREIILAAFLIMCNAAEIFFR